MKYRGRCYVLLLFLTAVASQVVVHHAAVSVCVPSIVGSVQVDHIVDQV